MTIEVLRIAGEVTTLAHGIILLRALERKPLGECEAHHPHLR